MGADDLDRDDDPDDLDDLVSASADDHLRRNGIPGPVDTADRQRAHALIREVLGDDLAAGGLLPCPLGVGWTEVFDAYVGEMPAGSMLTARGWLSLDRVLDAAGRPGTGRWAVTEGGRVLAAVHVRTGGPGDPVALVLGRAAERGEVRLRDVLELQALRETGAGFPESSSVLTAAADIESGLERRELVRWASGRRLAAPAPLTRSGRAGARRPRRVVVACSGVDGSGKTTLLRALRDDLERCGVTVSRVWLRPGMGLGRFTTIAARVKRRVGVAATPGIAAVAADPDRVLPSRRGLVGWVWSMLVTLSFIAGLRRQLAAARGVVLCDRHVADALVTLDFAYAGSDLRVQRWLVRRLVPPADVAFHLDVPVEVAVGRKPGDPIGTRAVARQVESYEHWLPRVPGLRRLRGTRPQHELARAALEHLLGARPGR